MVDTRILSHYIKSPLSRMLRETLEDVSPSIDRMLHHRIALLCKNLDLITEFNNEIFLLNICKGCDMQTEDAYSSKHLDLSNFGTCKCPYVKTYRSQNLLVYWFMRFKHPSELLLYKQPNS